MPKIKKELIIAGGSDSVKFLPYEEKAEIWGVNDLGLSLKRFDRLFELHSNKVIQDNVRTKNYREKLKKLKKTIYMQEHFDDIPMSVEFPIKKLVKKYGKKFFSTFDYMMAMAIEEKFTKISLYGVDLAIYEEYLYQRPSAMYWIGWAKGMGIEVFIQENSGINMSGVYAFENSQDQSMVHLLEGVYKTKRLIQKAKEDEAFTDGVMTAVDRLIKNPPMDLKASFLEGQRSKAKVIMVHRALEDKLQRLLDEISAITGHSVIIPEREIEIKK